MKMTKQGVRDLNDIKSPPRKVKTLEGLPTYMLGECKHPRHITYNDHNGNQFCRGCGKGWDCDGKELQ